MEQLVLTDANCKERTGFYKILLKDELVTNKEPQMNKEEEQFHGVFSLKDTPKDNTPVQPLVEESLDEKFRREQGKWTEIIHDITDSLKNPLKSRDTQLELHNRRQEALEQKHFYLTMLAKLHKDHKKKLGRRTEEFPNAHDRKMRAGESTAIIEAHLANELERIELVQNQVDFFYETIKGIDNIVYGIKWIMNLEEYKR